MRLASLATTGAAAAFYLAWELLHRGSYLYATSIYPIDDADEWRYTACSRLVTHGYALFTQVFSAQPPLLLLTLAAAMRVSGETIQGARTAEILFGLVALLATAWVAWQLSGPISSAAAALCLAVSPAFLVYSHAVEAEVPMMALVTLSLAVGLFSRRRLGWPVAGLAGMVLAAAVLMKLFALAGIVPGLWVVAAGVRPMRRAATAATSYAAAALIPVAADLLLVSPRQQWAQVVTMHQRAAGLESLSAASPVPVFHAFISLDAGLAVLAFAGLVVCALRKRFFELVLLVLWLPLQMLMLVAFRPLFPHHLAILSAALAASAGVAVGLAYESWRERKWIAVAPAVAGLVVYLAAVPRLAHDDRHVLVAGERPGVAALQVYIVRHVSPSAMIAADDLQVADRADRLVPPPLCDPSNVRLRSGYLTTQDAIRATVGYNPVLVVPSFGIYAQLPGYVRWVERRYRIHRRIGGVTVFALHR